MERELVYYVNSLPYLSCALVSSPEDLEDALPDVARAVLGDVDDDESLPLAASREATRAAIAARVLLRRPGTELDAVSLVKALHCISKDGPPPLSEVEEQDDDEHRARSASPPATRKTPSQLPPSPHHDAYLAAAAESRSRPAAPRTKKTPPRPPNDEMSSNGKCRFYPAAEPPRKSVIAPRDEALVAELSAVADGRSGCAAAEVLAEAHDASAEARLRRSVLISELAALVVIADGSPGGRAAVRIDRESGRYELLATERTATTRAAAVANTRRALEAVRNSPRLPWRRRQEASSVTAGAFVSGDLNALTAVLRAVVAALKRQTATKKQAEVTPATTSFAARAHEPTANLSSRSRSRSSSSGSEDESEEDEDEDLKRRRRRRWGADAAVPITVVRGVSADRGPTSSERARALEDSLEAYMVPSPLSPAKARRPCSAEVGRPPPAPLSPSPRRRRAQPMSTQPRSPSPRRRSAQPMSTQPPMRHGRTPFLKKKAPVKKAANWLTPPPDAIDTPPPPPPRRRVRVIPKDEEEAGTPQRADPVGEVSATLRAVGAAKRRLREARRRERGVSSNMSEEEDEEELLTGEDEFGPALLISRPLEMELRGWLAGLGLRVEPRGPSALRDTATNGSLLADLLSTLTFPLKTSDAASLKRALTKPPSSVGSAIARVRASLRCLPGVRVAPRAVVAGDRNSFWTVVANARSSSTGGQEAEEATSRRWALEKKRLPPWRLPYSSEQRLRLVVSLTRWLRALRLIGQDAELWSLALPLANGSLLNSLALRLAGKKHAVVTAKTETLERATVKKALALMRDWSPPLGWRHPSPQTETAVAAADWGVLLALLEDCHRVFDGQKPRSARARSSTRNNDFKDDDDEPYAPLEFDESRYASYVRSTGRRRPSMTAESQPPPPPPHLQNRAPAWQTTPAYVTPASAEALLLATTGVGRHHTGDDDLLPTRRKPVSPEELTDILPRWPSATATSSFSPSMIIQEAGETLEIMPREEDAIPAWERGGSLSLDEPPSPPPAWERGAAQIEIPREAWERGAPRSLSFDDQSSSPPPSPSSSSSAPPSPSSPTTTYD